MPFRSAGKSSCRFREAVCRAVHRDVRAAETEFPELKELAWPSRGSKAEIGSLLFQAGRFERVEAPANLQLAITNLQAQYPRSRPRSCFRREPWCREDFVAEIEKIAHSGEINLKASPGVPLAEIGVSNQQVIEVAWPLVCEAVVERLHALASVDPRQHDWSPEELVKRGLCDPVRLFVKQEPHSRQKIEQGRFRLISSVSLVDQLVERMLFGPQNTTEIALWHSNPSKPGMGLSKASQVTLLWEDLARKHQTHPGAMADISGFDWSVQDWELWADVSMRIELGSFPALMAKAAISRFYCLMNATFQLTNGELLTQELPGLMKSGSYCTSSSNSRIRCLMAELIGSPWCIAMGDDSVEGWVDDAPRKYSALGHLCKEYEACPVLPNGDLKEVSFCSHLISKGRAELETWPKCLFRYLSGPHDVESLEMELSSSRRWGQIVRYLRRIGRVSGNDGEERSSNESPATTKTQGSAAAWGPPQEAWSVDGASLSTFEPSSSGWFHLEGW
nr:polyprotein P2b [Cocksfoot mottle virus]